MFKIKLGGGRTQEVPENMYWHTTSHIMAQAVKRLFPNAKVTIGPAIEKGFYYDFDVEKPFTEEDLRKIEEEMKKIIKEDLEIERFELPREEAIKLMQEKEEPYKVELIEELPEGEVISFYKQGEFTDLCRGPHLPSTGCVKAIKLLSSSGAYWRGDEHNKMLQRIYGISFPKQSELDEYLNMIEELRNNGINYDKLICNFDKAKVCEIEKIDIFIDDSITNCNKVNELGIKTILFNSKKNKRDKTNLDRVDNWQEVYERINKYDKK